MSFGSPYLLALLVLVPVVAIVYRAVDRRRRERAASFSNPSLLANIVELPSGRLRYIPFGLFLLGLTLLVVGFARPKRHVLTPQTNAPTVVLAFDVSGSMAAGDIAPTRLSAARAVALKYLRELPASYRVAVLTFGDVVKITVPPTTNRATVISHLPRQITPKSGTSLGDAITAGVSVVVESAGPNVPATGYAGLILLLSDGAQTAGGATPAAAANEAFVERVPVDTVTIGTPQGSVVQSIEVDGFDARVRLLAPADPATMSSIAHTSEGTAYTVSAPDQVDSVGSKLKATEQKLVASGQRQSHEQQLSAVLGGLALALIAAGFVVSGVWFGRVA